MRHITVILTFLFLLGTASAGGSADAIQGTVVSLSREEGKMVVNLPEGSGNFRNITVFFSPNQLPGCIREGEPVRLWGTFSENVPETFDASYIRGRGRGRGRDATGVRSRLGKGCRMRRGGHCGRGRQ
ncbi:hypothetical protein DENIS_2321 [Desulfonema ishimotonii]|uniref:DNA-binding protein n=1 Tax=Desulfonema ishimotonii TaxID=45657 RepID=A0A401FWM8_9BACT|nr:hypothetical protein [Desulfonema ishimotonii]GBC61361.1 hypothetical protein DENIS_2321 [Desulfonema ishimotonii]